MLYPFLDSVKNTCGLLALRPYQRETAGGAGNRKLERGMPTAALDAKSWSSGEPVAQVVAC